MHQKITRLFILQLLLFLACQKVQSQQTNGLGNYKLIWSDEFNSTTINTNTWNFETGGSGWGNHEQEYYQAANAGIEEGNLVITGKKETVGSNGYTSARMTTQSKKEFF